MRIIHAMRAFPFGGAQRVAMNLAHAQSAAGHEVGVLLFARDAESAKRAVAAAQPLHVLFQPDYPLAQGFYAISSIDRFAPEIVHLHLAPFWLSLMFPLRRHYGLVAHLHTRPTLQVHAATPRLRLTSIADAILLSRCDKLIAVSEWAAASWSQTHPRFHPKVVHNGVPLPAQPPLPRPLRAGSPFLIGIAVRLSERKGMDEFLDLAAAIHCREPSIRFVVAGDGPMADEYRRIARERGLADVVAFTGFVEDVCGFWRSVDCAAFMSSVDTFGLGIIEPISQGRPVLAYRTGTGSDEVIDRCRGVESVPYSNFEKLADIAIKLSGDPVRRACMAAEGYDDCRRHFSVEMMAREVGVLYADVLAERQTA